MQLLLLSVALTTLHHWLSIKQKPKTKSVIQVLFITHSLKKTHIMSATTTAVPTANHNSNNTEQQHQLLPPTYIEGWSNLETVRAIPYRRLGRTDMVVSLLTLGAAHVSAKPSTAVHADGSVTGTEESVEAIHEAVRLGVNLIDTSPFYGQGLSEVVVGQALKGLPRQSYYIATKAGRHPDCSFDFSSAAIRRSVEQSLVKLGVEYIDLLQIHDVEFGDIEIILSETLPTLARLREENKIRYIGITGYPLSVLKEIIERSTDVPVDTVLSYCRHTLFDDELCRYLPFFESKQLGIISASPFAMGLFNLSAPIPYWHPAPKEIQDACQLAAQLAQSEGHSINRLALAHSLAETRITTHLMGMETPQMARLNVSTVVEMKKLGEAERLMLQRLQTEVFSQLTVHNWEHKEVARYHSDPQAFVHFLRFGGKQSAVAVDQSKKN